MSVQSEIDRIKANVEASYAAVKELGGTVPDAASGDRNSANLAAAVNSIPIGVTEERLQEAMSTKQDTLTGNPGQVVGFNDSHTATPLTLTPGPNVTLKQAGTNLEIGAVVPGKNLLKNWDFRKPVNRNGKTEYIGTNSTIDMWRFNGGSGKLLVKDGYCTLSGKDAFIQDFESGVLDYLRGKEVTFSVFTEEKSLESTTVHVPDSGLVDTPGIMINGWEFDLYNYYFRGFSLVETSNINVVAIKLELGDHQTLARQNESGEWEIIDPPDYDLQYLLCSQYSPITGEWVGLQHSNPNLLDNWYFANPINQRGNTEYRAGYTIDRWVTYGAAIAAIQSGSIRHDGSGNPYRTAFYQRIENYKDLRGKTVTFSAIAKTVSGTGYILTYGKDASITTASGLFSNTEYELSTFTFTVPNDVANSFNVAISTNANSVCDIIAAKLELGPVQTLAHKEGDTWVLNDPPPNKAVELLKCQRYFQRLNIIRPKQVGIDWCFADFKVTMRATPAITNISSDPANVGLTYTATKDSVRFKSDSSAYFEVISFDADANL